MNKLFTLLLCSVLCTQLSAIAQSCCTKPTGMQALAMSKSFKASHAAPLPLHYTPQSGKMITFPVTGGAAGNAFYIPADEATDKVLVIFHEWWGLNDYIKREAETWHKLLGGKVSIYAADLYDGKVATNAETAGKLMGGLQQKRGEAIVKGALASVGKDKRIATLGWCMGGSWSFTASVLAGSQAAGCVMYYGFPEKDMARIKPLKCDVVYIYGAKDEHIKITDVHEFEKKVQQAGRSITMYSYDAVHAFANPSNPNYDARSAGEAQNAALSFLHEKLSVE
ncbi:MAG: dienelactone hydrolase family protein [Bacteroidota bacterium]